MFAPLRYQSVLPRVLLVACAGLAFACGGGDDPHASPQAPLGTMDAQTVLAGDAATPGALGPSDAGSGVFPPQTPIGEGGVVLAPSDAAIPDAARPADAQAPHAHHDHCVNGETADARDKELTGKPDLWRGSAVDLVLPAKVLAWMNERKWSPSHDAWHNVRRCRLGGIFPGGRSKLCDKPELVAPNAECANAQDGYEFLVMHRHMMQALRQAFPTYPDLFQGFAKFPFNAADVPMEWQGRWGSGWSASIVETARLLEDVENRLSQFPTEGDLGKFMQCGMMANGASSIHGALHFKWVVNDSPHSLGKQTVNIENYMFWKLHGWIDQIWERYRVAKGLKPDEPKLKAELTKQCREMDRLGMEFGPVVGAGGGDAGAPLPVERGFFHERVRPILEKNCSGCHSEASPDANMSLGGKISSADVVKGLVNSPTAYGGQFLRVVPGDPSKSWLYLKVSGTAAGAGCMGAMCRTGVMPPAGMVTVPQADIDTIRQWIMEGATAPTN